MDTLIRSDVGEDTGDTGEEGGLPLDVPSLLRSCSEVSPALSLPVEVARLLPMSIVAVVEVEYSLLLSTIVASCCRRSRAALACC